jgi:hypothetical protein
MTTYTLDIAPDVHPQPAEIATNADYLTYVLNRAAESYQKQYGTASKEDGITAAREAYNASMPPAQEPAE